MTNSDDIILKATKIHLVGIKGVGMTAVALCLQDLGKQVTGSDSINPQITDKTLSDRQIPVKIFSENNIDQSIDLVIYSGAYKQTHPELQQATTLNIPTITQAEALAQLTIGYQTIAVCGVGGKTTTTSMLIKSFLEAGDKPSYFVGVSTINNQYPPGKIDQGQNFIVEADEYAISTPTNNQAKFSLLSPKIIVCTNLVHDHPDIYPDFAATCKTFVEFFNKLPDDGLLLINYEITKIPGLLDQLKIGAIQTIGTDQAADWHIAANSPYESTITYKNQTFKLNLSLPGQLYAFNATAALAVASHLSLPVDQIINSLNSFKGTKRRLELIKNTDNILYFDDYGHHPIEIKSTLATLKTTYPNHRLIVVFQPHTYSRTKALLDDFAVSLSIADEVILAPIFASAREAVDPTVSIEDLATAIKKNGTSAKALPGFTEIIDFIKTVRKPNDIIATVGAGDIYHLHESL
jgi:UDP-N-acetylmuramate--alanine ligase